MGFGKRSYKGDQRELRHREVTLERDAHNRVRQILKSKTELQSMIRAERKAAIKSSRATLLGKLMERIAPCFITFAYDPRDMRCISDPFDYVLFDGLTIDRRVKQIAFIEVKCGRGSLSPVQRSVREAVDKHRVFTEVWTVGDPEIQLCGFRGGWLIPVGLTVSYQALTFPHSPRPPTRPAPRTHTQPRPHSSTTFRM